jgi:hypothetical protein
MGYTCILLSFSTLSFPKRNHHAMISTNYFSENVIIAKGKSESSTKINYEVQYSDIIFP